MNKFLGVFDDDNDGGGNSWICFCGLPLGTFLRIIYTSMIIFFFIIIFKTYGGMNLNV